MSYIGNQPTSVAFLTDTFSGNGSTTAFTLQQAPANTSSILVAVSGVVQDPSTYSVSGTTITFSGAPPSGSSNISVRFLGIPASGVATTAYRTLTTFTATSGQTTFSVPSYTVGYIDVYRNGVKLGTADFTATSGTSVVLASGATAGDLVETVSFYVSSVLNAIPAVAGAVNSSYIANDVTINFADGSASTPSITNNGDTNTGIFFPAADTIAFAEGGAEVARFDSSGNLGIGVAPSAWGLSGGKAIQITGGGLSSFSNINLTVAQNTYFNGSDWKYVNTAGATIYQQTGSSHAWSVAPSGTAGATTTLTEAMRIDSSGRLLVGKTDTSFSVAGSILYPAGQIYATVNSDDVMAINRLGNDGNLIRFFQDSTEEGNISVSGTTVSYNGGHLARWSQLLDNSKDESILKGTVLSNLDEMCVWEKDGVVAENEQLNKMKVSDVEGDTNVAGVFVNWTKDEDYNSDDMNIAMTGDMIIRIAQGVTVQRGDLLMSAGDGTAKPQGDDIVRSKTIAKVTSTHITCTYEDGSYCVPCVLMAC